MAEPDRTTPSPEERARDLALARAALEGGSDARRELARRLRCVPRMLAVLNRRRGGRLSTHDLEDLSQEVTIVILRKLGTFAGQATLEGWVHRICFLELQNHLRSAARGTEAIHPDRDWTEEDVPDRAPDPAEYELVERSLAELGTPEADAVRLKHYEQLTFDEIAAVLDISPNTAKSRYYRGIAWLQRHLQARVEAGGKR